ncbi:gas2 domain containing protein [Stylonychia lemnae]|uniref:Gas2 domain containing protein n=1 Tax=Stylonychia lemnae TaxID=5949 RepID=A0A077ZRI9_STYLE|nr:gas2 domain containing protein [Stylonychia lemnae]|eukprot:CDW71950.1 gas2 domain containing protein [Stylonychia lemnae]
MTSEQLIITVGDIADIPHTSSQIDKSLIGCYIHLNNRLIDVMVLSDVDYFIKIPINSKSNNEDKISIMFKKLASGDDEEPIGISFRIIIFLLGKFDDSLGAFKEASVNQVVKKWISLASRSSQIRDSNPLKENAFNGPRALIYYCFGESSNGIAAIQEEIGTLGKDKSNLSQSSPFKDRYSNNSYSNNNSISRNMSSEKKSTNSFYDNSNNKQQTGTTIIQNRYSQQNEYQEIDKTTISSVKNSSVIEGKQAIDESKYVLPSKMHKDIRNDPDVAAKIQELEKSAKLYMQFDMQKLQNDMNKELEGDIQRLKKEYQSHQEEVQTKLKSCEQLNKNSQSLKNDSVSLRQQKQKGLQEISQKNLEFEKKYSKDNSEKSDLRGHMVDLEKKLRELQREIAATNLENETLKALLSGEQELRDDRNTEETHALLIINDDLKQNIFVADEDKKKGKKQREHVEAQILIFDKVVSDSKQKVQDLIQNIQQSQAQNQEQLQRYETELKAITSENRNLKITKEKQESSIKQLERDIQQLQQQDKQLEIEWNKKIDDVEKSIHDRRQQIHELLDSLQDTSTEISQLKVQAQTNQYKLEYELSLKEMYDTHQYENRMRKINTEIEQSQKKTQILREELTRISEYWSDYYEDSITQLRQRIEELNSQSLLDQIDKLLHQIKEKDAILSELQYGINDIQNEVSKVHSTDQELQQAKQEYQEKFKLYHRLLNEKSILYDQMYVSARQLINRDELIIKNEQEIVRIKYDIDISKLEMEQKKELVVELETQLEQLKATYKELKLEIKRLEKRAELLQVTLKQKEDELDQLEEMLRDRDNVIEELERQIGDRPIELPKPVEAKKILYRPIKGDLVDELIAKYVNGMTCPLPIKRLGDGNYLFGTKKIYAKIMNGKLVIRVGGGFMSIEEFIATYADFEITKVQQMMEKGTFNMDEYSNQNNFHVIELSPKKGARRMGSGSPSRDKVSP